MSEEEKSHRQLKEDARVAAILEKQKQEAAVRAAVNPINEGPTGLGAWLTPSASRTTGSGRDR
jgi:hypothetical protein